jgi:hypothetical protein
VARAHAIERDAPGDLALRGIDIGEIGRAVDRGKDVARLGIPLRVAGASADLEARQRRRGVHVDDRHAMSLVVRDERLPGRGVEREPVRVVAGRHA